MTSPWGVATRISSMRAASLFAMFLMWASLMKHAVPNRTDAAAASMVASGVSADAKDETRNSPKKNATMRKPMK